MANVDRRTREVIEKIFVTIVFIVGNFAD